VQYCFLNSFEADMY